MAEITIKFKESQSQDANGLEEIKEQAGFKMLIKTQRKVCTNVNKI